jgi:hypothetical protein
MIRKQSSATRRQRRVLAFVAVTLLSVLGAPGVADASMSGPCTAQVNGQDVSPLSASDTGDAIEVDELDTIAVASQSTSAIGGYRIQLEYFGIRWTIAKGQSTNNQWSREVKVSDYARYGAGVYRVHGVSDGSSSCDGAVLIDVGGNPLTSLVGIIALILVALGVANAFALLRVRPGRAVR